MRDLWDFSHTSLDSQEENMQISFYQTRTGTGAPGTGRDFEK